VADEFIHIQQAACRLLLRTVQDLTDAFIHPRGSSNRTHASGVRVQPGSPAARRSRASRTTRTSTRASWLRQFPHWTCSTPRTMSRCQLPLFHFTRARQSLISRPSRRDLNGLDRRHTLR
jgi:hypothetical protein